MALWSFLCDVGGGITFDDNSTDTARWVHALPIGNYKHPVYGDINIDAARVKAFVDSVKNKVRGIEPSINYDHNNSGPASGWVKDADGRDNGVWLFVDFTADAIKSIKEKAYKYFSAEFNDEWTDSQGVTHKDVILGGALTNRPFMKNLVPVNLSEDTYKVAFELISAITGTPVDSLKGGTNVELTEEQLTKIAEKTAETLLQKQLQSKPADPAVQKLTEIPELKALAEENPLVKLLLSQVETQNIDISTKAKELKEAEIQAKLRDFDGTKIILTPVARKLAETVAMNIPAELSEPFWQLLTEMKRGSSFLVQLGETAGATVHYGSQKSAQTQLQEIANGLKATNKQLSDIDAFEDACKANPALYAKYRNELLGVTN